MGTKDFKERAYNIQNVRLLHRDDLREYDKAFRQEEDNRFMGYTGVVLAQRDQEKLRKLRTEEEERDNVADLVDLLDKFTEMEE